MKGCDNEFACCDNFECVNDDVSNDVDDVLYDVNDTVFGFAGPNALMGGLCVNGVSALMSSVCPSCAMPMMAF